jgi:hypothetical protein
LEEEYRETMGKILLKEEFGPVGLSGHLND